MAPSDGRGLRTVAGDVADPSAIGSIRELVGAEPVDLLINDAAVGGSGRDLSPATLTETLLRALGRAAHPLVIREQHGPDGDGSRLPS